MTQSPSRSFLCLLLPLLLVGSACPSTEARVGLPYYSEASFTPRWNLDSAALANLHAIPAFRFTNQNGAQVTEETVRGKIYVANFFFTTCPGICPKMTANLKSVQAAFADNENVAILSHSVTPNTDTVDVLAKYAKKHGLDGEQWHLLTGERQETYRLGRHSYFVEEDLGLKRKPDEFLHTENFVLVDQDRHIRGIYNGLNKTSVRQLITDMKSLLNGSVKPR